MLACFQVRVVEVLKFEHPLPESFLACWSNSSAPRFGYVIDDCDSPQILSPVTQNTRGFASYPMPKATKSGNTDRRPARRADYQGKRKATARTAKVISVGIMVHCPSFGDYKSPHFSRLGPASPRSPYVTVNHPLGNIWSSTTSSPILLHSTKYTKHKKVLCQHYNLSKWSESHF